MGKVAAFANSLVKISKQKIENEVENIAEIFQLINSKSTKLNKVEIFEFMFGH